MESRCIFLRNGGFGDALWTEPIVRYFLDRGHRVDLFCRHVSVFAHYPSDRLRLNDFKPLFPPPLEPISLDFFEWPKMHVLEAFRIQANIPAMELSLPRLHLTPKEKERKIQEKYAILHLDPYKRDKNFRNAYGIQWEKVLRFIKEQNLTPLQISAKKTPCIGKYVPTNSFRDVMSLMLHANLFIGLDSGPSHIAAAMRIPSVLFFGSVNPAYRHLDTMNKVFLQSPCPFAHCYHDPLVEGLQIKQACRLVPPKQRPPCCIHDTERVIEAIRSVL